MPTTIQNFTCTEVQVLNATTTSGYATFATTDGINSEDLRVINLGPNGAWILPVSSTSTVSKNIAGGVAGTSGVYILSGEDIIINKGANKYVAAICDAGTAQLLLHSGKGA